MKIGIGVFIVVLMVGALFIFNRPSGTADTPKLSFTEVQQATAGGAKLYDVRTSEEFKAGHFQGAVNLSLQDIQAGKLPDVPKDTQIFVYCKSGNRSGQATTILKNAGFTDITDLRGLSDVTSIGGTLITN